MAVSTGAAAPVSLDGEWTLARASVLEELVRRLQQTPAAAGFDVGGIARLDTAGAVLLLDLIGGPAGRGRLHGLAPGHAALLDAVMAAACPPTPEPRCGYALGDVAAAIGRGMIKIRSDVSDLLGFIGLIFASLAGTIWRPGRWRLTALVAQLEQTGLNAVPIVALLTFLVGCVVAFLGATVLRDFGATVFTVELVTYSFLREFGVLLTAILVAGRSGSAFTAQIGSMKSREEIDAIRTLALDPVELLVLPRVLALLISMPLLTFIGMLAGLTGGGIVCAFALDISPTMYIARIHDNTELIHFWVGMSKAPVFALLIAAIGCLEGTKVTGSAESVGAHTTSSVVQSIFIVILIDAMAAIFFMQIGW